MTSKERKRLAEVDLPIAKRLHGAPRPESLRTANPEPTTHIL